MALSLNQFSTELSNTTSTGLILSGNIGINANYWRVDNDGTLPLRLTLASTVESSSGYEIKAGESKEFYMVTSKYALFTSSSSTEDHRRVRVFAMAG